MICAAAVVRSNTHYLAFGEQGQQVGFSFDPEVTAISAGGFAVEWPALSPALRWARLAPAPVGTVLMFVELTMNS